MTDYIISGPPPKKRVLSPAKAEEELIVQTACTLCQYGWLKWSWDFEHLMLCCPACKVGEPIYMPWACWEFIKSFRKVTNWICVSIQSIEE